MDGVRDDCEDDEDEGRTGRSLRIGILLLDKIILRDAKHQYISSTCS